MFMMKFMVDKELIFYAFKYSLGRMSFAPVTITEYIKFNINIFSKYDLELFIKDINECENYGMDFDKMHWLNFSSYLEEEIKNQKYTQFKASNDIIIERDILIYAFRYCLFGDDSEFLKVVNVIENNISNISQHDIELFIREIKQCQSYGEKYNKACFSSFIKTLENSLDIVY